MLLSSGCSTNKRLGESRIEARRYSKGWHVNSAGPTSRAVKPHAAVPREEPAVSVHSSVLAKEGSDVLADADDVFFFEDHGASPAPGSSWLEAGVDEGEGYFFGDRHPHEQDAPLSPGPFPEDGWGSFDPVDASEPRTSGLPEPVAGRHPDAVLGFVLSLGWLMGLLASTALEMLGANSPSSAFGVGLLLSLAGYFLSRSAYRTSRANPERYPRSGLSASARWVAGFPVVLGLIYLVVVVIVYIMILGFLLGSW